MNKDQIKGEIKKASGNLKEAAGKLLGDKTLANKGKLKNIEGKFQRSYGNVRETFKKGY